MNPNTPDSKPTLGQVAYETRYHGVTNLTPFADLTLSDRASWEKTAAAVYEQGFEKLPDIASASVKVMRSHDYCHFEIQLSTDYGARTSLEQVDLLRKEAARLADKAVEQYKVAKTAAWKLEASGRKLEADRVRAIAEPDRTPGQKAVLKAYQDSLYDYQDDWSDACD